MLHKGHMLCYMPVLSLDSRTTISGLNQCVNTWHLLVPSQPTNTEASNLVNAVGAFLNSFPSQRATGVSAITGSRVLYFVETWWTKPTFDANGKLLTKGKFNTEPIIIGATSHIGSAGTGGAALPPQLATVVSWRTATAGRSGRGRTYVGNLATVAMTGPAVTAATVSAINTAATNLIAAIAAITVAGQLQCRLAVWSPTKGLIREVLSGSSDATFDTMRSRVK